MNKRFPSFTIVVLFVCLIISGLCFVPMLPVKLSSSKTLGEITVSYSMRGASGRVVENEVTSKLEAMLNRIEGIKEISSSSSGVGSWINLKFDKSVDMDIARFEVSNAIRQLWAQMPDNVSYPSISARRAEESSSSAFLNYTVNASVPPIEIQRYVENYIQPEIAKISGISTIGISGATPMEWVLEYDSDKLVTYGISISDIRSAVNRHMEKEPIGMGRDVNQAGDTTMLRVALISSATDFDPKDIQIKKVGDKVIMLSELTHIKRKAETPSSYYRINGLNTINLRISADENVNQLSLADKVKQEIELIKQKLPTGYELHLSYDSTEYIRSELDKIYFRSGMTVGILLLFVLLVSRSLRYLLMIVISILANMSIGVIFYYMLGVEIHLFSLAGLTISMGLIIDNTIVMADHLKHRQNFRVFLAILAATLTTIAALIVIFFLPEKLRLSLEDFAMVIIVNMAVSLFIALFLVPALMDKLGIYTQRQKVKQRTLLKNKRLTRILSPVRGKKMVLRFNRYMIAQNRFIYRFRVVFIILLILGFGLPVFMLPDKVEGDTFWAKTYMATFGSPTYKEKIKPHADKYLGGTLRLFTDKVSKGSYSGERGETTISVRASMPSGTTLEQMDAVMSKMESYLTGFPQIRQFQSSVRAKEGSISIYFTKEHQNSSFPYQLKNDIISKAIELGGASWGVYGMGDGFNNNVSEQAGSNRVMLFGYNYDHLWSIAEQFKQKLMTNQRIKEVLINSEFSWVKSDYSEFNFSLDKLELERATISPYKLFSSMNNNLADDILLATRIENGVVEKIKLSATQAQTYDVWGIKNIAQRVDSMQYKLSQFADIERQQSPQRIVKINQQYRLCIQYDYIGSYEAGNRFLANSIEEFKQVIPVGFSIERDNYYSWGDSQSTQYKTLGLIIVIIFFLCAILFNSLTLPFAVIMLIPVSFIGLFSTFYLFDIKVDQGVFAAMVLLCGITVNAGIYILNDFNSISKRSSRASILNYQKAYNSKITSISLTILSTILGFIPFLIGAKEGFWYPLAIGTMGGLIFSIIGIVFLLPLFVRVGKVKKEEKVPNRRWWDRK